MFVLSLQVSHKPAAWTEGTYNRHNRMIREKELTEKETQGISHSENRETRRHLIIFFSWDRHHPTGLRPFHQGDLASSQTRRPSFGSLQNRTTQQVCARVV